MPIDERRAKRIGEEIRQCLAEVIQNGMNDPRIPPLVSINEVKVSSDLSYAEVYYTHLPDDEETRAEAHKALRQAAGFLKSEVAARIRLKFHPELRFHYDQAADNFTRIDEALRKARGEGKQTL